MINIWENIYHRIMKENVWENCTRYMRISSGKSMGIFEKNHPTKWAML